MVVDACFLAILFGAAVAGSAEKPPTQEREMPVAANQVLADVEHVGLVVVIEGTEPVEPGLDVAKLKTQIVEKLSGGGVKHVEKETGRGPTLVVQIEGRTVPGSDKYVYRVQAALERSVLLPGRRSLPVQARVWQGRAVLAVVTQAEAGKAVVAAALAQTEAFAGECQAARSLPDPTKSAQQNVSAPEPLSRTQPADQKTRTASEYPFIASRNGAVFHRPDCRWAQNITGANLVGYKDREEAVQAGKRPCKSCQP